MPPLLLCPPLLEIDADETGANAATDAGAITLRARLAASRLASNKLLLPNTPKTPHAYLSH